MSRTRRKHKYKTDDEDDVVLDRYMKGVYDDQGDYDDECTPDDHEHDGRIIRKRILDE